MPDRSPRPTRFPPRMTDAEALMWQAERDPLLRSAFSSVTILEHPPDVDVFVGRMDRAVQLIPRLRQRVVEMPGGLGPPIWAIDDEFDLRYHVRHVGLPPPGSRRQLLDLASLLHEEVLDPARPMWTVTAVDGLDDGRAALITKMHHTISDGVGAIRLSAMFTDLEPHPDRSGEEVAVSGGDGDAAGPVTPPPSLADVAFDAARRPLAMGRQAVVGTIGALGNPVGAAMTAIDVARQAFSTGPPGSPLWSGRRSVHRRFGIMSCDMEAAKHAAKALGGTLNDFLVTAVVSAAGDYHRCKGVAVDDLRAAIPVSTRADKSAGGNAFVPTRTLVPAGDLEPAQRFAVVHDRLTSLKADRSIGAADAIAGVVSILPGPIVRSLARAQTARVDFAVSNVRGAPFDLFIGGAPIIANYPFGPTGATAFNATLLSYRGSMDIGLNIDGAAIDDPELLRQCVVDAIDELVAATK